MIRHGNKTRTKDGMILARKNDKTTTIVDTTTPNNKKVLILFFVSKVPYLYGCNTPIYLSNVVAHDVNIETDVCKKPTFKIPLLTVQF
jgi:hypothetical protein